MRFLIALFRQGLQWGASRYLETIRAQAHRG